VLLAGAVAAAVLSLRSYATSSCSSEDVS